MRKPADSPLLRHQRQNARQNAWRRRRAIVADWEGKYPAERLRRVLGRIDAILDDEPFQLFIPVEKRVRERFANNSLADGQPRLQKVLFSGSHTCLPGQGDLFQ